ncbi:hypothetical protein niasHT_015651 [Heterodera trifolii]|uniref:C2H2-type domain-containing protein n=1 Tax=Heterodera trifolii TaxID=157864 RepID=A0ABD2L492_9BILA
MFTFDQNELFAQIGAQQQQLLLNLSNQLIVGGMETQIEKIGRMGQMDILEEQLKEKERRKCNELWTEFVSKMMFFQNGPVEQCPHQQQQNAAPLSHRPTAFSLPATSPFSTISSVGSLPSEPTTPTERMSTENVMMMMSPKRMDKGNGGEKGQRQKAPGKERPKDGKERVHKCDQCQKAFRFKSNLFEHKSLHLGSSSRNPFVCPFCSKTCRLKGNLKKHLQVHVTSAEDLECLWKRSFSRSSGRPSKNAPPAPLPKPGDDLGMVPVLVSSQQDASSSSPFGSSPTIKWTLPQNRSAASSPGQSGAESVPRQQKRSFELPRQSEVNGRKSERRTERKASADGESVLRSLLGEDDAMGTTA